MRRFVPIIVPVAIWALSIIPAIAPGIFNLSRMADIVLLGALGWLLLPTLMILIVFFQAHLAIQLAVLFLLLFPIGPLLVRPLLNRHGFGWLSAIYSMFLFVYLSLGFYLASERINGMATNNIYGYKYPEHRYDKYDPFISLSKESISDEFIFTKLSEGYPAEYEIQIPNGGFIVVDDNEQNMDWALRKLLHIPESGYAPTTKWHAVQSRRANRIYFFCKIGDKYGKGVIHGGTINQVNVFMPEDNSMTFGSQNTDPGFANWLKWFVKIDKHIYMD